MTSVATAWRGVSADAVQNALAYAVTARAMPHRVWEFLTAEQGACVEALVERIVPSDDTPGAREAGVAHFVDRSLATWAVAQRGLWIQGLIDLDRDALVASHNASRFADLPEAAQIELLKKIERTPFFQAARFTTLLGMFALPAYGGNAGEVGWRLIGFEHRAAWQPPFGFYDAEPRTGGQAP